MNWLREIVSGKRRRFQDDQYNLDITYITQRVLAMSFPAKGLEKLYRNSIDNVAEFLRQKHGKNFRVFNMSGREYDTSKFDRQVESYPWEDHHSPALHVLFQACEGMLRFLNEKPENVVVVHCNAGKGRTGTLISCFLIYSGLADNAKDAITYYGFKRFSHGKGVTQPSQIRYVYYFERVYKRTVNSPCLQVPEQVVIHNPPDFGSKIRPYCEILNAIDFKRLW
jgi:phosphatidylinositol-3,4,5-trisphosphate 3-phosphatase and dual-specificity protein phosphatase PTEN